jgi:hypothetical protein
MLPRVDPTLLLILMLSLFSLCHYQEERTTDGEFWEEPIGDEDAGPDDGRAA